MRYACRKQAHLKNLGYEESGVDFAWKTEQFKNLTQGFQR